MLLLAALVRLSTRILDFKGNILKKRNYGGCQVLDTPGPDCLGRGPLRTFVPACKILTRRRAPGERDAVYDAFIRVLVYSIGKNSDVTIEKFYFSLGSTRVHPFICKPR